MKKILTTSYFCILAMFMNAQKFKVDTILYSGPTSNRVNLVILGDGYRSSEQAKFLSDANTISQRFMETSPYTEYKNYYNVFAVEVISTQSGANHAGKSSDNKCGSQPIATVNNYFGSSFDAGIAGGGYHRLLVVTKSSAVTNVLAANAPFYDQALIVVNSPYYGGAGGQYAVSSMAASASEVSIHEVGHSFPRLADEYWAGSQYATDSKPNMTSNGNSSTVKWKIWNGVNTVGVYPHSGDPNWFKPTTSNCKMEILGKAFCPVCREAHIEKIHSLVKPYDSYTPANTSTIPVDITNVQFSVKGILPIQNTLKVQWLLNGTSVKNNSLTYALPAASVTGTQQLQAKLIDTTSLVRIATHFTQHVYLITWNVKKTTTGIEVNSDEKEVSYLLSGNPLMFNSFLKYDLNKNAHVQLNIVDMSGKIITLEDQSKSKGSYMVSLNPEDYKLASGTYLLSMTMDGTNVIQEKIVISN
jgi:hypothetical protein